MNPALLKARMHLQNALGILFLGAFAFCCFTFLYQRITDRYLLTGERIVREGVPSGGIFDVIILGGFTCVLGLIGLAALRGGRAIARQLEDSDDKEAVSVRTRQFTGSAAKSLFWIGHVVAGLSVGLTALAIFSHSAAMSGVPMGLGLSVAFLLYAAGGIVKLLGR